MNRKIIWGKLALAGIPIAFALIALLYPHLSEPKPDDSVLLLVALGILVVVVPWERLTTFKVAGVELALENSQIDKAIDDLRVLKSKENINDERLWALLRRLAPEIEQAKGSRILWIDDSPYNVLGERRLLRALDIETIMAASSEMADQFLCTDGDYDLIISDLRSGKDCEEGDGGMVEAVRFIKELRKTEAQRQRIGRYSHIPSLPVIFFSGKDYKRQLHLIEPVRDADSMVLLTSGTEKLLLEVLRTLSYVRSRPVEIVVGAGPEQAEKMPCDLYYNRTS